MDGIYVVIAIVLGVLGLVVAAVFGLLAAAIIAAILLGWIALLVIGTTRLRKRPATGWALMIVGGIWAAAVAASVIVFGVIGYRYASSAIVPTDFNAKSYRGTVGDIILPNKTPASLVLAKEKTLKRLRVEISDGTAKAPVGSYKVESYSASATDADGNEWTAEWTPDREQSPTIVVGDAPVHLDVGPPFVATVTAETTGRRADFALEVTGNGNRPYTLRNTDARASPPRFEVLDGSGNVVWSGDFEYG